MRLFTLKLFNHNETILATLKLFLGEKFQRGFVLGNKATYRSEMSLDFRPQ